jgi:DNA-binding transcriptional LysR family regulator
MQLRHVELISAILRAGSLTQAAALLNISQPAASKMLAHAELQLGFALFRRVRGRLRATPELEAMAPALERLHEDLGAVRRLADNLKLHPKGRIRVGSIPALGLGLLPPAIKACRDREPGIVFDIHTYHTSELVDRLYVRQLDLAVCFDTDAHPGLAQMPIGHTELVHVSSGEERRGEPVPLGALAGRPLITLDVTDRAGALLELALAQAGVTLQSEIQVQTHYVACALAHAGCGDTVVDALTAGALLRPGMRMRRLSPAVSVPVCVLHHASVPLRETDLAFIESLRTACSTLATGG